MKKNLKDIYNEFALTYEKNRNLFDMSEIINELDSMIKVKDGKVLDLGCGAGEPFAKFFTERGFKVTGVDFSEKMLAEAKRYVPKMRTVLADMREVEFGKDEFDIITAVYSLFHLKNHEQEKLIVRIKNWLKKGGLFLFTYATEEYTGKKEFEGYKNFMGRELYYAHRTSDYIRNFITEHGFNIKSFKYRNIGGETFLWIIIEKN